MLVFDSFRSEAEAHKFVRLVQDEFRPSRRCRIFLTADEAEVCEPGLPVILQPVIVYVERRQNDPQQDAVIAAVNAFDGMFVGTDETIPAFVEKPRRRRVAA